MRCRGARRILLAALDGEVTAADRAALDRHLGDCEACRREAAETARLGQLLTGLPQVAAVPAGLEGATLRRVRTQRAAEGDAAEAWERARRWTWLALPMAASLAGLAVWRALPRGGGSAPIQVAARAPDVTAERTGPVVVPPTAVPERLAQAPEEVVRERASAPPPEVARALDLFLELPVLENMEKLQNFDSIRTVDVGNGGAPDGRG